MADDRLPCWRPESIAPTSSDKVMFRPRAISFKPSQNASSRLTLVLWPAATMERLATRDFMTTPRCCSKCVTSNEKICPALWPSEKNSAVLQKPHRACLSLSELTLCIGGAVRLELASPTFDRRSGWYAGSARPCAAIGCGGSFARGGNAVSALLAHGERGESPRSCGPCGLPQDVPSDKLKLRTGTIVVLRVDGVDRK